VIAVAMELAQAIIRDGEGASKFITIAVEGGRDPSGMQARVGYAIAHSPLVKTAFFASDPNLGRILAAIGYADIDALDVDRVSVWLAQRRKRDSGRRRRRAGRLPTAKRTAPRSCSRRRSASASSLGRGPARATVYTCDLSYDYVKINADYRS
jgi:glutamate N-acetyltransferase/amino-acid N-acetyltransferase